MALLLKWLFLKDPRSTWEVSGPLHWSPHGRPPANFRIFSELKIYEDIDEYRSQVGKYSKYLKAIAVGKYAR